MKHAEFAETGAGIPSVRCSVAAESVTGLMESPGFQYCSDHIQFGVLEPARRQRTLRRYGLTGVIVYGD